MSQFGMCGIGNIGIGKYKECDIAYSRWVSMLHRCYSGKLNAYENVTVCDEWLNYQNFAKWFEENNMNGYFLDKDLKVYGNKIYSPETCVFVPQRINSLFCYCKRNTELPYGVIRKNTGYSSSILPHKTTYSIIDALNTYWNRKYEKAHSLMCDYPEFEKLILNYFECLFNSKYDQHITP